MPEITITEKLPVTLQANTQAGANGKAKFDFKLTKLSDLLAEPQEDIDYLWQDTLILSGLSILVAKPKVGKSTLARNLALAVARGDISFLGRQISAKGPVVYLALEEKRAEVRRHFERMGASGDLPIFIHTGSAPEEAIPCLERTIVDNKAVLAIVDPLQLFIRVRDLNDYASVSLALEPIIGIARSSRCHIILVHHANKGIGREGGDSILGSTALFGSVDCGLFMKRGETYRTLESQQRYGEDLPKTVLAFDSGTGLVSCGGTVEEVDIQKGEKAVLEVVTQTGMTEDEIKEHNPDIKGGVISKALRQLLKDSKVRREGGGKKMNPYRYAATASPVSLESPQSLTSPVSLTPAESPVSPHVPESLASSAFPNDDLEV